MRRKSDPAPVTPPVAGVTSLAVPAVIGAERVRGRGSLIAELTRLHRWGFRRTPRVRVLHGLAGAGKTTVALHVAHRLGRRGVTVWFVSAAEDTALQTGMRQLARLLGAGAHELDRDWADNAPDVLWRRLNAHPGPWLLIIDNADGPHPLTPAGEPAARQRGWIRPVTTRHGALLITSRDGDRGGWGDWCRLHPVGMLRGADGARVLRDLAGHRAGTATEAAALADRLGGFALALTLAGHYLADTNQLPLPGAITSFAAYRGALDAQGAATVDPGPGQTPAEVRARTVIAETAELSLGLLDQRGLAPARALLGLLAVLADAPIPYQVLLDPAALAVSPLFPGIDAAKLRGLLHALAALGLLDLDTGGANPDLADTQPSATLRLHPLIREAGLHQLRASGRRPASLALAAGLLHRVTTGNADDPARRPCWEHLAPHPVHLLTTAAASGAEPGTIGDAAVAALRVTEWLAATGLHGVALTQAVSIRDIATSILGAEDPTVLEAAEEVAHHTGRVGDVVAARDQFAALLPLRERVLGPEHPDTLTTRADLAAYTGRAGDVVAARDQLAALLPLRERVLGPEHADTLIVRAGLAGWTGQTGDVLAARDQCAKLLPISEWALGPDHPDTMAVRADLAHWSGEAGDVVAARDQYAALLPISGRVLGPDHPNTLIVRANLAGWT
ncbi:hypothetical protein DMB66_36405, partial [Actinoplanes sp. ATCC 53533]|uniref:tetratricopeptide repeat protein n=1 Tax=Actinoplanes sp. ATCC 53533 TaxID=1288362 RepID=UPI000F7B60DA